MTHANTVFVTRDLTFDLLTQNEFVSIIYRAHLLILADFEISCGKTDRQRPVKAVPRYCRRHV